jgi:hypothetical protein
MTHSPICRVFETHDLTYGCEDCESKVVGDCDNGVLMNICGHTRAELEEEFGSGGPFDAFWDVVIRANAMKVRARYHDAIHLTVRSRIGEVQR